MPYQRQRTLGRYGRPNQQTLQPFTFPACITGVNAVDSLMQMPATDCLYTYNLMPAEYGMRLRKGYREWAINCIQDTDPQTAPNQDVRTIIPFESNIQDPANDRLFAVTPEGIWNVTLFNDTAPDHVVSDADGWLQKTDPAGFGVFTEFTGDAAGDGLRGHYLFYADGLNGVWQYEEALDAWERPFAKGGNAPQGQTPATDPPAGWYYRNLQQPDSTQSDYYLAFPVDNVAFVMVHKQRIWVILEDEDDAWYLPTASVAGELKLFTFGSKMPHGGNLMGLYNWTVDGGDGVDDFLVAVGRGGDVIMYSGEDPEITPDGSSIGPWQTKGTWFIGETPASRRLATAWGPDLFILSTYGLTSLMNMLQGSPIQSTSPSKKVNRFLRVDVENGKDLYDWQLTIHPADGFMQIVTPKPAQTPYIQYNMNLQTAGWGFWEGVPIHCGFSWNGDYFMGGNDGVVWINDGVLDGTEIAKDNFFQDVNPVVGVGWSVPVPLEFQCDGSQVAETEYTTDMVGPLTAGTTYVASYRVKQNSTPTQYWQDLPDAPIGPEWSVLGGEYTCDGTQVAETEYRILTAFPLKAGCAL